MGPHPPWRRVWPRPLIDIRVATLERRTADRGGTTRTVRARSAAEKRGSQATAGRPTAGPSPAPRRTTRAGQCTLGILVLDRPTWLISHSTHMHAGARTQASSCLSGSFWAPPGPRSAPLAPPCEAPVIARSGPAGRRSRAERRREGTHSVEK